MELFTLALLPVIGYIPLKQVNEKKSKAKPISGIELTYHSSIYGLISLITSYIAVTLTLYVLPNCLKPLLSINDKIVYNVIIILAFAFSYLYSLKLKAKPDVLYGDTLLGETWFNLLANRKYVVLFLKNGKAYIGQLSQVDLSERISIQERQVTLGVILSGIRTPNGNVQFNTQYNVPLEHHFNMSEIINFSEYQDSATFEIDLKSNKK